MSLKDLIADVNVNEICEHIETETLSEWVNAWQEAALSALRPVSRERVVLCKDCRYWQGNNGDYPHPECRWGHNETPDEDDYCSFAEELEVNKNG